MKKPKELDVILTRFPKSDQQVFRAYYFKSKSTRSILDKDALLCTEGIARLFKNLRTSTAPLRIRVRVSLQAKNETQGWKKLWAVEWAKARVYLDDNGRRSTVMSLALTIKAGDTLHSYIRQCGTSAADIPIYVKVTRARKT